MKADRLEWIIIHLDWDKPTPWEESFVEVIEKYYKKHGHITEKQEDIMERLHKEKTL